jgi:hypothetical protein
MDGYDAADLAAKVALVGVVADNRHAASEFARARSGNDGWCKLQKLRLVDLDVPLSLDADAREELLESKENGSTGVGEYTGLPRAREAWLADEKVSSRPHRI